MQSTAAPHTAGEVNDNFDSPLLKLPGELRNRIYELLLVPYHPPRKHRDTVFDQFLQPSITRTCSQLRRETLPIFYLQNNFFVRTDSCDFNNSHCIVLYKILKTMGENNRKLLGTVYVPAAMSLDTTHVSGWEDAEGYFLSTVIWSKKAYDDGRFVQIDMKGVYFAP